MFTRDGRELLDAVTWNESLYERRNHHVQRMMHRFARADSMRDDVYVKWMRNRLAELVAKDPSRCGDEPTPEMEADMRRGEEREAAIEEARRRNEEAQPPVPSDSKKPGWRLFG